MRACVKTEIDLVLARNCFRRLAFFRGSPTAISCLNIKPLSRQSPFKNLLCYGPQFCTRRQGVTQAAVFPFRQSRSTGAVSLDFADFFIFGSRIALTVAMLRSPRFLVPQGQVNRIRA